MKNKFVVFILSHGRADSVTTYKTLQEYGFTGEVKIICDNEDKQIDKYIKNFGDNVIVFDKKFIAMNCDSADNFDQRDTVLYARNASYKIASELGYQYFLVLDDDYDRFAFRSDGEFRLINKKLKNIDLIFDFYFDFLISSGVDCVAMAQCGGDFILGKQNGNVKKGFLMNRKIMNSFFCDTKKQFNYLTRLNDDVSTYVLHGSRGKIFITCPLVALNQKTTQAQKGGLTESYLKFGTYVKSFYSLMVHPSSVKVKMLYSGIERLHHGIKWENAVPKIIREQWRK
jgi:hypothetical protein